MGICVKIELADNGQVSVGQEPLEEEQAEGEQPAGGGQAGGEVQAAGAGNGGEGGEGGEGYQSQPVRSIDEALAMAKQILEQAQNGGAQGQEQQGFDQGFAEQAPQSIAGLMK